MLRQARRIGQERARPEAAAPGVARVLAVVGPTASGKTQLGVELARALGGEIISADSQQICKSLDIGTAKPTPEQMRSVPHYMVDAIGPFDTLSAGEFMRLGDRIISELHSRQALPVIVGGTGLWVRALLQGIVEAPTRDDALRARLEERAARDGRKALHDELASIDPETAAKVEPRNIARTIRALELYALSGEKPSILRARHAFSKLRYEAKVLGIAPPREELYRRIDARAREMFETGLIDEVRSFIEKGERQRLLSVKAFGYPEALAVIDGRTTLEDAIKATALRTRHYAKRQLTWFRADPLVEWLPWPVESNHLAARLRREGYCAKPI